MVEMVHSYLTPVQKMARRKRALLKHTILDSKIAFEIEKTFYDIIQNQKQDFFFVESQKPSFSMEPFANAPTIVLWDIENCEMPKKLTSNEVANIGARIRSALANRN